MDNVKESILVSDVNIFAFNKLNEVTDFLTWVKPYETIKDIKDNYRVSSKYIIYFQDAQGQDTAIEFGAVAGHIFTNFKIIFSKRATSSPSKTPGCPDFTRAKF